MERNSARRIDMRVLLVEDSERLCRYIGTALKQSGYAVDATQNGEDGLWLAESNGYDVIVLDIMLPGMDGISILRELRRKGSLTHILCLTAKDTIDDRVRGLQAGADDYLVKPFAQKELLARVEALCRRAYGNKQTRLVIGYLEIDTVSKEVFREGNPVKLKPREYLILEYLARRCGEVVTRKEIEAHIYNDEVDLMSNVVDSAVCSLRKSIGMPNRPQLIHTRHGLGYFMKAEAE
jgi:DNA-binding response OmpR family regulator